MRALICLLLVPLGSCLFTESQITSKPHLDKRQGQSARALVYEPQCHKINSVFDYYAVADHDLEILKEIFWELKRHELYVWRKTERLLEDREWCELVSDEKVSEVRISSNELSMKLRHLAVKFDDLASELHYEIQAYTKHLENPLPDQQSDEELRAECLMRAAVLKLEMRQAEMLMHKGKTLVIELAKI